MSKNSKSLVAHVGLVPKVSGPHCVKSENGVFRKVSFVLIPKALHCKKI